MLSIAETLQAQAENGIHKVDLLATPGRFVASGMLAGAYIGIGVVLMVATAGPLMAAGSGLSKLVAGLVFGVALTLVLISGGELATSSMMTIPQAMLMQAVPPVRAMTAVLVTFTANLAGSVILGALVLASGVLHSNAAAGRMLSDMLALKAHESVSELFVRGLLCNVLVCLAVWMSVRLTSETARILAVFAAILAFVASGFEHVVANMTTYAIGLLTADPSATWAGFGSNLLWVGLGNLIGGAIVVGAGYWFIGGSPRATGSPRTADAAQLTA